ncbi:flavin-containing monooxygenase [Gordonia rubripertincta]|uniref:NAD(P)/FAD-dependent oxidoreductase n=1 Tax=Gordonia rubripertincta TaxID=36822 RepID=A0ABT4MWS5_GORRU|nr:NAD(P)/FAD-dependent oxidoreductase [Gordonia rubripertincta]MCZ4550192.1 NAD(P)/FAD-dependent oxidoreductase [Gordonia rubripertincta]
MQPCAPTQTPEVDIPSLREKYLLERDKRIRSDGQQQYLEAEDDFSEFYEGDPHTPVVPRQPITDDIEVVILGGGFCGLITAHRLQQAGVTDFKIIELGGDFGGVWYWNRYPGIQIDSDAYCYLPLLEETGYIPKEKFSKGDECFEHAQRIGTHFGLYDNAIFHTLIRSLEWDGEINRWQISTNRGDEIRARHVILCQGPYNRPKLPGIPGIRDFKGHTFHTARWDYEYTGGDLHGGLDKIADKKIAVIGTGSSGIQAIPHLAKGAKHLTVFQRTPSYIFERANYPTDPEWVASLEPGWRAARQRNFHNAAFSFYSPGEPDLICDGWTEVSRNMAAKLNATENFSGWAALADPAKFMELKEIEDYRAMERLRQRVEQIVEDPATAELLKPYYRNMCKRPVFNDEYLPTFNRPNVTLVDVSETKGVERITEKGIIVDGVEHEFDCIVFASGFEITTALDRQFDIKPFAGREGTSLYDHWGKGFRTLHGVMAHGFPNHFATGFVQGGVTASTTLMFEQQADHIAYIIKEAQDRGATYVEPTAEAEDEWVATIRANSVDNSTFTSECTPGYYNSEGEPNGRSFLGDPFWGGFYELTELLQAWRDTGELEGLVLEK